MDGWSNGWMSRVMDGWINGWMDGVMDAKVDGWADVYIGRFKMYVDHGDRE